MLDKFESRKNNVLYNTSYPLNPNDWKKYLSNNNELNFDLYDTLGFYIHIPFCNKLCSFCEYTKTITPNENIQKKYLSTLENDINKFINKYKPSKLIGFDIGGGTPTALSNDNFKYLLEIYKNVSIEHKDDFESSIEGTFNTLNEEKIKNIVDAKIYRLSLGIQSTVDKTLKDNNRNNPNIENIINLLKNYHSLGIKKINLDMMYGIKGQNINTIKIDVNNIIKINPEQITLYEFRPNMVTKNYSLSKDELYSMYNIYYDELIKCGYYANFGQNTFSLNKNDFGMSSYLRNRMKHGIHYKGFGISAQSMNNYGISYNLGKNKKNISNILNEKTFERQEVYNLPQNELASKFIAISGYYSMINLIDLQKILGKNPKEYYKEEINFVLKNNLCVIDGDYLKCTRNGFKNYGAIFSLFYNK